MSSTKDRGKISGELGLLQNVYYSLPFMVILFLIAPIGTLQGIYAKYYNIPLSNIAIVILSAKLFDAVSDPFIGYISDRHCARGGSRKPFILLGMAVFCIAGYCLYIPPENVTILYFSVWFILFYLGWTLVEIPHLAWGSELASDAAQKTRLFSFRTAFGYLGQALFFSIPLLPFFPTSEITPETLKWSATVASVCLVPIIVVTLIKVPNGNYGSSGRELRSIKAKINFGQFVKSLITNKPFIIFLGAYFFTGLGIGMWFGLIFIYVDSYLNMGDQFAKMFLIAFVIGVLSSPVWYKISSYFGKKNTWLLGTVFLIFASFYTGVLTPENVGPIDLILVKVLQTIGGSCMVIMSLSVLSDISDYGTFRSGISQSATYFATQTFLYKFLAGGGGALALAITAWYGFDMSHAIQSKNNIFGITLAISWLPTIFITISFFLIALIPMNERRHRIIRRRLASHGEHGLT